MNLQPLIDEIIQMNEDDLRVRKRLSQTGALFNGYNEEMEAVHIKNAKRLESIIEEIGWPTEELVGRQARDSAMLIVQHAISLPDFQRTCLRRIKETVEQRLEERRNYAYLHDRIRFNERRPQKFGTQYDWDEDGCMSPWTIEKPESVNDLRQEYGLNTIEEQTAAIRLGIKERGEKPPANYDARQQEILDWSRKTGWIK